MVFARQNRRQIEGAVLGPEAFVLRWYEAENDDRLAMFNMGRQLDSLPPAEPLLAAPAARNWELLWSSEDPRYGGTGTPAFDEQNWHLPGDAAFVFRAVAT
jgi:maltooligosyltrehalose trehalohydrolase